MRLLAEFSPVLWMFIPLKPWHGGPATIRVVVSLFKARRIVDVTIRIVESVTELPQQLYPHFKRITDLSLPHPKNLPSRT